MKKIRVSLLTKVVIAIAAGVLFGQFLPGGIARIFVTFNSLFGNFLSFSIPLIILGLVTKDSTLSFFNRTDQAQRRSERLKNDKVLSLVIFQSL